MILEDLGPSRKVFEDLPVGDYVFEVIKPKDWIQEFVDDDNPESKATYINWQLRVIQPEESEGRIFFHRTMASATPEKIAKAKKAYDPATFTYQFLSKIGVGVTTGGEVVILDQYLSDGHLDLNAIVGVRFSGSIREVQLKDGSMRVNLTECWPE